MNDWKTVNLKVLVSINQSSSSIYLAYNIQQTEILKKQIYMKQHRGDYVRRYWFFFSNFFFKENHVLVKDNNPTKNFG